LQLRAGSPTSSRKNVPALAQVSRLAALTRRRAGERAALVTEQLALDEVLGSAAQLITPRTASRRYHSSS
jgi:hypothetical protein